MRNSRPELKLVTTAIPQPTTLVLPEGLYPVTYVGHTAPFELFRGWRIAFIVRIDGGEYDGEHLQGFYRVRKDGNRFVVPLARSAHLRRDMQILLGFVTTELDALRDISLSTNVVTVKRTHDHQPLPLAAQYSRASRLMLRDDQS